MTICSIPSPYFVTSGLIRDIDVAEHMQCLACQMGWPRYHLMSLPPRAGKMARYRTAVRSNLAHQLAIALGWYKETP